MNLTYNLNLLQILKNELIYTTLPSMLHHGLNEERVLPANFNNNKKNPSF